MLISIPDAAINLSKSDLVVLGVLCLLAAARLFDLWRAWRRNDARDGSDLISDEQGFSLLNRLEEQSGPSHGQSEREARDAALKTVYDRAMSLFRLRLEQYQKNRESLERIIFNSFVFSVADFLAMRRSHGSFKVPLIGIELANQWFLMMLPACLLYLWVRFGFLFNELVNDRIFLWNVSDLFEAKNHERNTELRNAQYTYSIRTVVYDGLYIDGWFAVFRRRKYVIEVPHSWIISLFVGIGGVLIGLTHVCMLGSIYSCCQHFPTAHHQLLYKCYFWGVASVLGVTHYAFYVPGRHPNWMQSITLLVVGIAAIAFVYIPI